VTPHSIPAVVTLRRLGEVDIELATAGRPGGPTVILLHGFPDLWQGWHFQIPSLVNAGFRVLAPNQRGYGQSSKPKGAAAYDIDRLAEDVISLADSEGSSTFHLVGHDWGGIVAWWLAARFPNRVRRLVVLNAPHPGVFQNYLLRSPTQMCRSWYVGFFQLPWIPEAVLSAGEHALLFRSMKATSLPGVFDESDKRYLVAGWSVPGALTAMLNYYRAAMRRSHRSLQLRVQVPALVVFGKNDPAEEPGLADHSIKLCDRARIVWLETARHWVQREEHARVTDEILSFCST
jgi:pimeloyl-ACP methyl ester carboxylesterase